MATPPLTHAQLQEVVQAYEKCNQNMVEAAKLLQLPRSTVQNRLQVASRRGILPQISPQPDIQLELRDRIRTLEAQIAAFHRETLDEKYVKEKIIGIAAQTPQPPSWLVNIKPPKGSPGVPTLFASDWHWGEIVDPNQIGGVNEYDMDIAHRRARHMVETAIDLLNNHMVNPHYPGIVFALGGDMVSGDIHEELSVNNEREIMPVVIDLFGVLIWCITTLADNFGKVFVPCVTGNHGRMTHKIRAKGRNYTSFDWLLYCFLQKHFANDKRVTFMIPDGPDALYRIYNHRYLLTHGDAYRGGDGLIGCLGPILRGDHKKRSRNAQIDMGYDTQIIGHWHQLIQLERVIVNGSLKGYDEYANANNFGFEPPRQALWITHPVHGITFSMPVNVGESAVAPTTDWVSWVA